LLNREQFPDTKLIKKGETMNLSKQGYPKDLNPKRAAQAMTALHKSLYGREADIANLPIEEVNEDLQDAGIDPNVLIDRVRARLKGDSSSAPGGNVFTDKSRRAQARKRSAEGFRLNWRPKILIVASQSGRQIAENIRAFLQQYADCVLWIDPGDSKVMHVTFGSLEKSLDFFTHAVIVFSPVDQAVIPDSESDHPGGNLDLVLGLFAGRHGRHSVFAVTPDRPKTQLPSDVLGIKRCQYRHRSRSKSTHYNVEPACKQILAALKSSPHGHLHEHHPVHSKFWDALSSIIVIIFGGHYQEVDGKRRFQVSPRDLEAVIKIMQFLAQRYPQKRVLCFPAGTPGWHHLMKADADLILIGGFVTNQEFSKLQTQLEQRYRLRMGQICGVNGQRVFRIHGLDGTPLQSSPKEIEDLEATEVSRDYGLVISRAVNVHGSRRRVISLSGVKGNGTLGAAHALIQDESQPNNLNSFLPADLTDQDAVELVISANISEGEVHSTEITEVVWNDRMIPLHDQLSWEPCKLGRSCTGCTYGLASGKLAVPKAPVTTLAGRPQLVVVHPHPQLIIFDLDDTLVDTFGCLIMPLEYQAAQAMVAAGLNESSPEKLFPLLMKLRRENPGELETQLQQLYPHATEEVWRAREAVFANAAVTPLVINPEVIHMLRDLGKMYKLCLLTSGSKEFQNAKLKHLDIGQLFDRTEILDTRTQNTKQDMLAALAGQHPRTAVVVGNRLDHEIRAGNNLQMTTVWVRYGEGSAMTPEDERDRPTHIISDITELPELLVRLDQRHPLRWDYQPEQATASHGRKQPIKLRVDARTFEDETASHRQRRP
jgi:FMN phosphatase YigB (HAD superfamily)/predicted nucleotide-binding protein